MVVLVVVEVEVVVVGEGEEVAVVEEGEEVVVVVEEGEEVAVVEMEVVEADAEVIKYLDCQQDEQFTHVL